MAPTRKRRTRDDETDSSTRQTRIFRQTTKESPGLDDVKCIDVLSCPPSVSREVLDVILELPKKREGQRRAARSEGGSVPGTVITGSAVESHSTAQELDDDVNGGVPYNVCFGVVRNTSNISLSSSKKASLTSTASNGSYLLTSAMEALTRSRASAHHLYR